MKKECLSVLPIIVFIFAKAFSINSSSLNERRQFYLASLDQLSKPLLVTIDENKYVKYCELKIEFSNFVLETYGECRLKYYPEEDFTYVNNLTIQIETNYEKIKVDYQV